MIEIRPADRTPGRARAASTARAKNHACGQAVQRENVARSGDGLDIGCNSRRAKIGDQSMDGLSVKNPADESYYFENVIASAGTANASYLHGDAMDLTIELKDRPGAAALFIKRKIRRADIAKTIGAALSFV